VPAIERTRMPGSRVLRRCRSNAFLYSALGYKGEQWIQIQQPIATGASYGFVSLTVDVNHVKEYPMQTIMKINITQQIIILLFVFATLPAASWTQEKGTKTAHPDTSRAAKADSAAKALEAELARELGAAPSAKEAKQPVSTGQRSKLSGSASRGGALLNPRISAIGTFWGSATSGSAVAKPYDLGLAEAEISFQAYVDPYAKADFFVSIGREHEDPFAGPDQEVGFSGEYTADIEEGYVTSLSLPYGLQVRAGKFRTSFGKINRSHPHALNFVDMPRMYVNYFGEEGLNDRGAGLNWLIPNPFDLYTELTFELTSGTVDAPSFVATKDMLYLLHLKTFFDLNDNTTLELGLTGVRGSNDTERHKSDIGAADLTIKWKPLRYNRYKSFEWMTEALLSKRRTATSNINSAALYSFLRYQVAKRWFLAARYDYSEFPEDGTRHESAYSAILSFFTTEFQKFELQYQYGDPAQADTFHRLLLRAIFVIGAHGAHQY